MVLPQSFLDFIIQANFVLGLQNYIISFQKIFYTVHSWDAVIEKAFDPKVPHMFGERAIIM